MRKPGLILFVLVITMTMSASLSWAQAQARFSGSVVSTAGEPLAEAIIIITTDEATDFRKEVDVKKDGSFAALLLDATRTYKMRVEAPGYVAYERPFKVASGSSDTVFDIELATQEDMAQKEREEMMAQPGYKELGEAIELLEQGNQAEALPRLEAAVAARADMLTAWEKLAEVSLSLGQADKALNAVRECLDLDEESLKCLAVGVNASREAGDAEAEAEYTALYSELNPEDPAILLQQAAVFLAPDKMDDASAKPLLEQCLEVDPDFAECLYEYGNLLLRSGDMQGAKTHLQHYLEVAPAGANAAAARDIISYL